MQNGLNAKSDEMIYFFLIEQPLLLVLLFFLQMHLSSLYADCVTIALRNFFVNVGADALSPRPRIRHLNQSIC
jgi:hypothetical protein